MTKNRILWIVQWLLALLFLFAGIMKIVLPADEMTKQMPLPIGFLRFIGAAEIAGAFGLILPGLLRTRPGLTVLAAVGLAIIMIGAVVVTFNTGGVKAAVLPFITGLLLAYVIFGRRTMVAG
jgi:hypothetical protein